MWTRKTRGRMAKIKQQLKRYPTDLSDDEWRLIEPLMPPASRRGRPRRTSLREVVNALRYLVRTGCGWEMLPHDFPPWQTVYWWFRALMRRFLFRTIHDLAVMVDRERAGREASPTAAVIDSQSVNAPLVVTSTTADSTGAQPILKQIRQRWPWVKHLFAGGA
jgi:transposase